MAKPTVDINIEIHGLPLATNRILNALAKLRGAPKRVIIVEALVEYAQRHTPDLTTIADRQGLTTTGGDGATN